MTLTSADVAASSNDYCESHDRIAVHCDDSSGSSSTDGVSGRVSDPAPNMRCTSQDSQREQPITPVTVAHPEVDTRISRRMFTDMETLGDLAHPEVDLPHPEVYLAHPEVDMAHPEVDLAHPEVDMEADSTPGARYSSTSRTLSRSRSASNCSDSSARRSVECEDECQADTMKHGEEYDEEYDECQANTMKQSLLEFLLNKDNSAGEPALPVPIFAVRETHDLAVPKSIGSPRVAKASSESDDWFSQDLEELHSCLKTCNSGEMTFDMETKKPADQNHTELQFLKQTNEDLRKDKEEQRAIIRALLTQLDERPMKETTPQLLPRSRTTGSTSAGVVMSSSTSSLLIPFAGGIQFPNGQGAHTHTNSAAPSPRLKLVLPVAALGSLTPRSRFFPSPRSQAASPRAATFFPSPRSQAASPRAATFPYPIDKSLTPRAPTFPSQMARAATPRAPTFPLQMAQAATPRAPTFPLQMAQAASPRAPTFPSQMAHAATPRAPTFPPQMARAASPRAPTFPSQMAHAATPRAPTLPLQMAQAASPRAPTFPSQMAQAATPRAPTFPLQMAQAASPRAPTFPSQMAQTVPSPRVQAALPAQMVQLAPGAPAVSPSLMAQGASPAPLRPQIASPAPILQSHTIMRPCVPTFMGPGHAAPGTHIFTRPVGQVVSPGAPTSPCPRGLLPCMPVMRPVTSYAEVSHAQSHSFFRFKPLRAREAASGSVLTRPMGNLSDTKNMPSPSARAMTPRMLTPVCFPKLGAPQVTGP